MDIGEFLADQDTANFPRSRGPWISFEDFDPPYKISELRRMDKLGIIDLDINEKRFRLTIKATRERIHLNHGEL